MADSSITKRALAASLKECMEREPFNKISIEDICNVCQMNRKSFYYHFRDKYELVTWIFDTEFTALAKKHSYVTSWTLLEDVCYYFYDNRKYYSKILKIEGQNSFKEHFRSIVFSVVEKGTLIDKADKTTVDFTVSFYSDAFISAVERWLYSREPMLPEKFILLLKSCTIWASRDAEI